MRSPGRAFLFCFLLLPAAAMADEFDDFRIPEHRVFSWTGSLSSGASQGDFNGPFTIRSDGSSVSGAASTSLYWLHDSDPRQTSFFVRGSVAGNRARNNMQSEIVDEASRQRRVSENWSMAASQRLYPWRTPVGFELAANGLIRYDQQWSGDRALLRVPPLVSDQRQSNRAWAYDYELSASAAMGVGRVRDATSVLDVLVFEDRMRSRGVLKGPLSSATRNRLAQLYYDRDSYHTVLDRPGGAFWSRAIAILQDDPSFARELDAVSLLRALEPYLGRNAENPWDFLPRSPVARRRGVFAGVAGEITYNHTIVRSSRSNFIQNTVSGTPGPPFSLELSDRFAIEEQEPLVGPTVEWHRPLSLRWQADLNSTLLVPTRGPAHAARLSSSAAVNWIVADRWLASANVSHLRISDSQAWAVSYGANLTWFVENHLRLGIAGFSGQTSESLSFDRTYQFSLSLGYQFAGSIESPGLAEPIRVP